MVQIPLINNLGRNDVRRTSIGLGIGLLFVILLSLVNTNTSQTIISETNFDSETIKIDTEKKQAQETEVDEILVTETTPSNGLFNHFNTNKSSLTQKQIDAVKNNTPHISVIVNQAGQRRADIENLIKKMPNDVTIGLSSYTTNHTDFVKQLSDYGFEVWMDIAAIEKQKFSDFGPNAIDPTTTFANNIEFLETQLKNKGGLTGLILPRQALIIQTSQLWADIAQDIFAQGYGILDNSSRIIRPSLYIHEGERAPYLKGDKSFDIALEINTIKSILLDIQKNTIDQKSMIITMSAPTPALLDILAEWLNSLDNNGITLVPLSAQAKL